MLELVPLVKYKDETATILFVTVVAVAVTMLLVTTPVLWLLEMVLEAKMGHFL